VRRDAEIAARRSTIRRPGQLACRLPPSYIDPRILDRFDSGETVGARIEELGGRFDPARPRQRERVESAVLALIRGT
jgi:hypothetical protein